MKRVIIFLIFLFLINLVYAYEVEYIHQDHLGNNIAITNEQGEVIWKADYEPFGNSFNEQGVNSYKYNNKELDSSTGLLYYGARYYDAEIGRFTSADTIKGRIEQPQTLNRYVYVLNNPLKFIDLKGNQPLEAFQISPLPQISPQLMKKFNEGIASYLWNQKQKEIMLIAAGYAQDLFTSQEARNPKVFGRYNINRQYYQSQGLSPIDCIGLVTCALKQATGDSSWSNMGSMKEVGQNLKSMGWKAIYVSPNPKNRVSYTAGKKIGGENTVSTYNTVLSGTYPLGEIDYAVVGADVLSNEFKEQLKKINGFVSFQEGYHTGVLVNGQFMEVHWTHPPNAALESSPFLKNIEDSTKWQTAVIYVPPNTFEGDRWKLR